MKEADLIALWWHYESVAMHFNELIIQYRSQVMAGVGALGAAAGYLDGRDKSKHEKQEQIRNVRLSVFFISLMVAVFALAYLDLKYYHVLLQGAVDSLVKLEKCHPALFLSTDIAFRANSIGAGGGQIQFYGST